MSLPIAFLLWEDYSRFATRLRLRLRLRCRLEGDVRFAHGPDDRRLLRDDRERNDPEHYAGKHVEPEVVAGRHHGEPDPERPEQPEGLPDRAAHDRRQD